MIIVAGELRVAPPARDAYLSDSVRLAEQARNAPGCLDFHLSADPLEPGRINVYERWESAPAVEAFRGAGVDGGRAEAIVSASVSQYEIASSNPLT